MDKNKNFEEHYIYFKKICINVQEILKGKYNGIVRNDPKRTPNRGGLREKDNS